MALSRQSYYKWWAKFDYKLVLIKIQEPIESFKKMEREYVPEKKTVGIPSMSDFKELFPLASNIELKEKFLEFIQQQLNVDFSDCFQDNSSKSGSLMEEDAGTDNEDMEVYLDNLTTLRSPLNIEEKDIAKKDKGKAKA